MGLLMRTGKAQEKYEVFFKDHQERTVEVCFLCAIWTDTLNVIHQEEPTLIQAVHCQLVVFVLRRFIVTECSRCFIAMYCAL